MSERLVLIAGLVAYLALGAAVFLAVALVTFLVILAARDRQ